MRMYWSSFIFVVMLFLEIVSASSVFAQSTDTNWPMAGHDPERSSWTPSTTTGNLNPEWYVAIEPYVPNKAQMIMANDSIFVATAKGLLSVNSITGATRWSYATEMPLGNAPTYYNNILYIGGSDKKLYAINSATGAKLWSYDGAGAGYDTNPLVVSDSFTNNQPLVIMGNRDGYVYAVYGDGCTINVSCRGTIAWRFKTDGAIHFSAAYFNGKVYIASDDNNAYSISISNGQLAWKTSLPAGDGFHSWWPVVLKQQNAVLFTMSRGYRCNEPYRCPHVETHVDEQVATLTSNPDGSLSTQQILDYFGEPTAQEQSSDPAGLSRSIHKPWRKVYRALDATTGIELPTIIPFIRQGTTSNGQPYPPSVDNNGAIYGATQYLDRRGQIAKWIFGSNSLKVITPVIGSSTNAHDEPLGWVVGGTKAYWNLVADQEGGWNDYVQNQHGYMFFYNLSTKVPGYKKYYSGGWSVYGGNNGTYGEEDTTPPIPYKSSDNITRVYTIRSNALIAFSSTTAAVKALPDITISAPVLNPASVDVNGLKALLKTEIQKILDAGHLRPGYGVNGYSSSTLQDNDGDKFADYWSNPAWTFIYLLSALPYLDSAQQQALKTYLQNEFTNYSPLNYTHIGWREGTSRDFNTIPPEVDWTIKNDTQCSTCQKTMYSAQGFRGWTGPDWRWTPYSFYAMWKYAEVFGNAKTYVDAIRSKGLFTNPPSDTTLTELPYALNAWLAGYRGYMELERMAGYTTSISQSTKYADYNRLLALRVSGFSKDNYWGGLIASDNRQQMTVSKNFLFLVPEVADTLRTMMKNNQPFVSGYVEPAFNEYSHDNPYWIYSRFEGSYGEHVLNYLYDHKGMFDAKALLMNASAGELVRYLDVPAMYRGDLFYIHNLVLTLDAAQKNPAPTQTVTSPTPTCGLPGDLNCSGKVDSADLLILLGNFGKSGVGDINNSGKVDSADLLILLGNFGK